MGVGGCGRVEEDRESRLDNRLSGEAAHPRGQAVRLPQDWLEEVLDRELGSVEFRHGIIGEASLTAITNGSEDNDDVWAMPGMYHWHLTDAVAYDEPIPARGRQRPWYPS
jgi:hypothetical protein